VNTPGSQPLTHRVLKPPGRVVIFTVPWAGVRRFDPEALVYDVRAGDGAFLRHYSFFRRWFEVNVSLGGDGRLVEEAGPGGFRWAFNCDIDAPPVRTGAREIEQTDLKLDVLVAADGRAHLVKDHDEFERAARGGWLTPAQTDGAHGGLADLLGIVSGPGLLPFLSAAHPLPTAEELRALPFGP